MGSQLKTMYDLRQTKSDVKPVNNKFHESTFQTLQLIYQN